MTEMKGSPQPVLNDDAAIVKQVEEVLASADPDDRGTFIRMIDAFHKEFGRRSGKPQKNEKASADPVLKADKSRFPRPLTEEHVHEIERAADKLEALEKMITALRDQCISDRDDDTPGILDTILDGIHGAGSHIEEVVCFAMGGDES